MELRLPDRAMLPSYIAALERGWHSNNMRPEAAADDLAAIAADPEAFVASLGDRTRVGPTIRLPDGSVAQRIPGFHKWMWDGEFCGAINLRWVTGTTALPPHVLGHIGYAVVPWKRRRGYATEALRLILLDAAAEGLDFVELTTDLDNVASQRVIISNGGVLVETFQKLPVYGEGESYRYRIMLCP